MSDAALDRRLNSGWCASMNVYFTRNLVRPVDRFGGSNLQEPARATDMAAASIAAAGSKFGALIRSFLRFLESLSCRDVHSRLEFDRSKTRLNFPSTFACHHRAAPPLATEPTQDGKNVLGFYP